MKVEPFPKVIPQALRGDPEVEGYIQRLHDFLFQLWERTGGSSDLVESSQIQALRRDSRTVRLADLEGFYMANGVPDNAMGTDGNFYYQIDGTTNTIYHKRSGAWVALA